MGSRLGVAVPLLASVMLIGTAGPGAAEVTTVAPATVTAGPATPAGDSTPTDTASTTAPSLTVDTTTAPSTSTAATAPAPTTTAASTPTPTQPLPAYGCVVAGIVLAPPGTAPFAIGPVAQAPAGAAGASRLSYPDDRSILSVGSVTLGARGCSSGQLASTSARFERLSLLGGAVTASRVGLTVTGADGPVRTFVGLHAGGRPVHAVAGARVTLGTWGYPVVGERLPLGSARAEARLAGVAPVRLTALAVHLVRRHGGLPAGTVIYVGATDVPAPTVAVAPAPVAAPRARPATVPPTTTTHAIAPTPPAAQVGVWRAARRSALDLVPPDRAGTGALARAKKRWNHEPLTVTPSLRVKKYVFPLAGQWVVGDTYGALRSDVPGGWHHGDDIFAPLGTPLVAVADGTLNRVGWERLGGWRLWVRDNYGNQFYYAHLSGYAPAALGPGTVKRVKRGEVIAFLGNTGDAFSTAPHLHFEIHPRSLLHLHYDGAVDPTTYLQSWTHVDRVRAPRPVHPRLPVGPARIEGSVNFRELLSARGLLEKTQPSASLPTVVLHERISATQTAADAPAAASTTSLGLPITAAALGGAALIAAALWFLGGWRRPLRRDEVALARVPVDVRGDEGTEG